MKPYLALVAVHATTGYVLAVGVEGFLWGDSRWAALRAVAGWVVLAGGAHGLHAAFTRPTGAAQPRYLMEMAAGAMVAALALSFTLTPGYRVAAALCFTLGVLYAVPPVRLAERGAWDVAGTALAFGFLTPYAGVAATGKSLDLVAGLVLVGFAPLAAGYRGLAVAPGRVQSPRLAIWGCAAAFGVWLIAWLLRGEPWYVPAGALLGLISLAIGFGAWMRVLSMNPAQHRRGQLHAGIAWIVTDGAVVAAFGL